MKTPVRGSRFRFRISVFGLQALILLAGLATLLYFLMPSLSPDAAQTRVHLYLLRTISQEQREMLRERDVSLPDTDLALQWKEAVDRIKNLRFVSVKVKRPLPELLNPLSPDSVVRVVLVGPNEPPRIRYFWLSWAGIDRECSKLAWTFSF